MQQLFLPVYKFQLSLIQGLSRLSDQEGMVAMLGGSRPNPVCECAIVDLPTPFYIIVMCDINMTTFELTLLG